MEVNEEKRQKFMENAGKRVNNIIHAVEILEPMSRSSAYDFTRQDVDEMFTAMEETLEAAKQEFYRKFEGRSRAAKKTFAFGQSQAANSTNEVETNIESIEENEIDTNIME